MYDIAVIGGGPAGLTAAIYGARAGKSVLVLEKDGFGGQIVWSPKVENFPGFASVSGMELGDSFLEQALSQGAEAELEEVCEIAGSEGSRVLRCASGAEFSARTVILAAGTKPRMLGLEKEQQLIGSGISFCAVCDGSFYKGRPVAVVGGGSSALQEALYLCGVCSKVYLIHRRDSFRGEEALAQALRSQKNAEILLDSRVTALAGETELSGITVTGPQGSRELAVDGLFLAVGHVPELGAFAPLFDLDEAGYGCADESCAAGQPDLFIAGDCRTKRVRQLTTAAADGSCAALAACRYLDSH